MISAPHSVLLVFFIGLFFSENVCLSSCIFCCHLRDSNHWYNVANPVLCKKFFDFDCRESEVCEKSVEWETISTHSLYIFVISMSAGSTFGLFLSGLFLSANFLRRKNVNGVEEVLGFYRCLSQLFLWCHGEGCAKSSGWFTASWRSGEGLDDVNTVKRWHAAAGVSV